jgi:hypothetical protein
MSAADVLRVACSAGVTVTLDGDSLLLEAMAQPPQAVLDALSHHKPAILVLLRSGQDGWTAEDWRARFDERAGFLEHDGVLTRVEAEAQAFECCIVEWLNRNPPSSWSDRCTWCGKPDAPSAVILPFGAGEHHVWLHAECWPAWHQSRRVEADTALRKMGLRPLEGHYE